MRFAIALLALAACAAPQPQAPVPPPPREEPKAPPVEAANADWERILRDLAAGRGVEEQQLIALSNQHYELALAYFNKGDFDRAKTGAQEAVRIWPENIPARRLLSQVGELIIGRPAGPRAIGEQAAREALVATEQAELEITMHVVHGKRYFDAKMYESAAKEFEDAEFKILHLAYDVKSMNELLPKVRELKARSKSSIRD
jgi:tetratricopeptide (TPR) repeat protein